MNLSASSKLFEPQKMQRILGEKWQALALPEFRESQSKVTLKTKGF